MRLKSWLSAIACVFLKCWSSIQNKDQQMQSNMLLMYVPYFLNTWSIIQNESFKALLLRSITSFSILLDMILSRVLQQMMNLILWKNLILKALRKRKLMYFKSSSNSLMIFFNLDFQLLWRGLWNFWWLLSKRFISWLNVRKVFSYFKMFQG